MIIKNFKILKWWLLLAIVFFVIIIGGLVIFNKNYSGKFYPGVQIGQFNVGGQTKDQVLSWLEEIENAVQEEGLVFNANEKKVVVNPIVISSSPDLAKQILVFHWNKTVENAYGVGRSRNWLQNLAEQARTMVLGHKAQVVYGFDKQELIDHLKVSFTELEKKPRNASLRIAGDTVEIVGEQSGYVFDYDQAADQLVENVKKLNFKPVSMDLKFQEPTIKKSDTGSALNSIEKITAIPSLSLVGDGKSWDVTNNELAGWLEFQLLEGEVVVGVNKEKVFEFLTLIADSIDIDAVDAKFELSGNRVTEFQSSRDGKVLNLEESYANINRQVMIGDSEDIELVVEVDPAKVATADLNDLGIKELLGRGVSNFSGSPVNRRHNIKVGADSLNGVLIAPGEEFSLLDALGEIDGGHGYLQELVIKGNRTIPEYGGGLCQIGSTTFRAALWSGLPITARRNHSYRVSYYEPAGMDATIYDPAPDMKFLNDTGHHVLFLAKMEGDDLIFEFYGTPDGREVTIEPNPPAIYNITSPGPPRYIETDDLPPGEKRKVESAHAGADTYFKYTVTYPDGRVEEEEFYSHYVPWRETWLIGRDPNASTSTEEVIDAILKN